MIAALPMYDLPEIRGATDRFWALVRDALRAGGVPAPDLLSHGGDPWEIWLSPELVLAQTCGLPFRARLHDRVTLVSTPDYGLAGCPASHYNSVIITRMGDDGSRAAINDPLSQSGWAALRDWAAAEGRAIAVSLISGGHEASARAVLDGRADLAAIDAQTWRLLCRHRPWTADLRVLAQTPPTPGLPLVTARGRDPVPFRAALDAALAALGRDDRAALGLVGFTAIPPAHYLALPVPPAPVMAGAN